MAGAGLGGRAKLKGDGGLAKGLWLLFCMSWGHGKVLSRDVTPSNLCFKRTALAVVGG